MRLLQNLCKRVALFGNHNKMDVVGHEAVSEQAQFVQSDIFSKEVEVDGALFVGRQKELACVPALRHVAGNINCGDTSQTRHSHKLSENVPSVPRFRPPVPSPGSRPPVPVCPPVPSPGSRPPVPTSRNQRVASISTPYGTQNPRFNEAPPSILQSIHKARNPRMPTPRVAHRLKCDPRWTVISSAEYFIELTEMSA
jgi:hypothetical protein